MNASFLTVAAGSFSPECVPSRPGAIAAGQAGTRAGRREIANTAAGNPAADDAAVMWGVDGPTASRRADERRVLIIRRRYLGDVVLLEPLIRALAVAWPGASITVLANESYVDALELMPLVDHVLTLPAKPRGRAWWNVLRRIRAARFTQVLDLDNRENTALLTGFSGAQERRTIVLEGLRPKLPFCYTHLTPVRSADYESRSILETYFDVLPDGVRPPEPREPRLFPRQAWTDWARAFLATTRPPAGDAARALVIHPGSRSEARRWPVASFVAVIRRARSELGLAPVLAGGPGDERTVFEIARGCGDDVVVAPVPLDIGRWAALAAEAGLVLCHDSGPMHVAAGAGARVIALYGSQNARVWAPLGRGHAVLQAPRPCQGCVKPEGCVPGDSYRSYCTQRIPVDAVIAALRGSCAWASSR